MNVKAGVRAASTASAGGVQARSGLYPGGSTCCVFPGLIRHRAEKLIIVFPVILGHIHGVIRLLDQSLHHLGIIRENGNADAAADRTDVSMNGERPGERFHNLFGYSGSVVCIHDVVEYEDELIAPDPGDSVHAARIFIQPFCHCLEQTIAYVMAKIIVHLFEAIQVEKEGRQFLLVALGLGALSNASAAPAEQTAVFAGGCFWGVDAVFKLVKGVSSVVSGYAGGSNCNGELRTSQ